MSLNWVMTHPTQAFVRLPGEKGVYMSPPRTSLAMTTPRTYPGNNPVSIHSDAGILYLTNQRVVFLPTTPTAQFQSFSAPLLNLHDTHVTVPWFGPNAWQAVVQPVPGGNLPTGNAGIELKLTFKEGGAMDFHSNFERIKERLQQAIEAARDNSAPATRQGAFLNGINMDAVHLDQLPTYEASGHDRIAPNDELPTTGSPPLPTRTAADEQSTVQTLHTGVQSEVVEPPADAPPGYEETQQSSVQRELERRLSGM